ncbi:MAG: hypothetical protein D6689_02950 [Deltaproteobacteria bacterium]|nr:MAG: hypothetical protein D6689_02950 [Deltaproteobacteria bacterium]
MPSGESVALVLSGGGVRGAYEVGVVQGIVEALGGAQGDLRDRRSGGAAFRVFAGTSVGAINAAFLASHAHRADLGIADLAQRWRGLRLREHLRVDPLGLWQRPRWWPRRDATDRLGRSLLDPRPIERLIRESIAWDALHDNVQAGRVAALVVAALEIATGRTSMFAEVAPGASFRPSRDPRRRAVFGPIGPDHVAASAALPLLFPARRIGGSYYCDGGLRFNTPIAPAIRAGADKLVVVSVLHRREDVDAAGDHTADYPSLAFLLGKLLNALLLDPVQYDLQVLERFNRLWRVIEATLDPAELARVRDVLVDTRGVAYRTIDTLVFTPSQDIGELAAEFVARDLAGRAAGRGVTWLLRRATGSRIGREADFASYFLFDGAFADRLIALGRADAAARAADIRRFFGAPAGG